MEHPQEWICREHDVLWGAEEDGRNPGCWICGAPGQARDIGPLRKGLAELGGYGFPNPSIIRRH